MGSSVLSEAKGRWQLLATHHRKQIDAAALLQSVLRMRAPAATFQRVRSGLSLLQAIVKGKEVRARFARDLQRLRDIQQLAVARGDRASFQHRRSCAVCIQTYFRMWRHRHAYNVHRAKVAIHNGLTGSDAATIKKLIEKNAAE